MIDIFDRLYVRPLEDVVEDYNFLMGYTTGKQKEWYAGIEGITSIFNGAWSDPEVGYNGYAINETYLDCMWNLYDEECEEKGIEADIDDEYCAYLQEHKEEVFEILDNLIEAYKERT